MIITLEKVCFVQKRSLMGFKEDCKGKLVVTSSIKKFYMDKGNLIAESVNGNKYKVKSFDSLTKKELSVIKTNMLKRQRYKMERFVQNIVDEMPSMLIAIKGIFSENRGLVELDTGEEVYLVSIEPYNEKERIVTTKEYGKVFLSGGVIAY